MGILGSRAAAIVGVAFGLVVAGCVVVGCGSSTSSTSTVTVTSSTPTTSSTGSETATSTAAATDTGSTPSSTPTFGAPNAFSNGAGFGEIKPARVFLGGDPTGDFLQLKWQGWGSPSAVASGVGNFPPPNGPVSASTRKPIKLIAFDLGPCKGQTAYRQMTVTFYVPQPQPGSTWKICQ